MVVCVWEDEAICASVRLQQALPSRARRHRGRARCLRCTPRGPGEARRGAPRSRRAPRSNLAFLHRSPLAGFMEGGAAGESAAAAGDIPPKSRAIRASCPSCGPG